MKNFKIIALSFAAIIISTLVFVGVANAQNIKAGDNVSVAKTETVDSMLFTAGNIVDIAGTINGDVFCAGGTITISGTVNGDVFCAGNNLTIGGVINGSVRLAGASISLTGTVNGNATVAGQSVVIASESTVSGDVLGGSETISINGSVGRDILAGAQTMSISGNVGRDINGQVSNLDITSTGVVSGKIDYTSENDPNLIAGSQVVGDVTVNRPTKDSYSAFSGVSFFVYYLLASIVLSLVVALAFPKVLANAAKHSQKNIGNTVLTGVIAVFVAPVALVIIAISIVGIPLAITTLLAWIVLLMLSLPFSAYLLGQTILKKSTKNPLFMIITGVVLISIAYFIPIIGTLATIAVSVFGSGMILNQARGLLARK